MKTIYLALACWDYEGSSVIKAFEDEQDAHKFVEECNEHKKKRPEYYDESTGQSFDDWEELQNKWFHSHPASESWSADSYTVVGKELVLK